VDEWSSEFLRWDHRSPIVMTVYVLLAEIVPSCCWVCNAKIASLESREEVRDREDVRVVGSERVAAT